MCLLQPFQICTHFQILVVVTCRLTCIADLAHVCDKKAVADALAQTDELARSDKEPVATVGFDADPTWKTLFDLREKAAITLSELTMMEVFLNDDLKKAQYYAVADTEMKAHRAAGIKADALFPMIAKRMKAALKMESLS